MSKSTKYPKAKPGEWIAPVMSGHKLACCDCGLVHVFNYRVDADGEISFQAFRDNRATGQLRRNDWPSLKFIKE